MMAYGYDYTLAVCHFFVEVIMRFNSLEDAINCYGRENLIPIDYIKQQLFYAKCGVQPKFIWEKEGSDGKLTAWYLKCETTYAFKKWKEGKPEE